MSTPLQSLAEQGQSPWIDYISRPFIEDGDLEELVRQGILGVTSNPTIFQGAIADGNAYDEQLREVLQSKNDPKEVFLALARDDIRHACDLFSDVFNRGDATRDGWVSLEVDPNLAHDASGTSAEARRLHQMIDRPNLFVKIPGTKEGLQAIEDTIAGGIPVNVTLLFSLERHREAAEAYIRGLRRLQQDGGDLHSVASVASFFVSRVDTEADGRLEQAGDYQELRGTLAIANAKLAYQTYKELFTGPEWRQLAAAGASPQRCLWASTSTKTRTIATCSTSRSSSGQTPWTRCRARRSRPSRTTAASSRRSSATSTKPGGRSRHSRRRASSTTTSWRCSSARACRSSPTRSAS